jgi:predicted nucleic acid-binding Zn ribbon protein
MPFESILEILAKARLRHPQFGKRLEEAEALGRWPLAVGPQIAKHTRALRVEKGVLWIEVDHPIWKSELHHRKRQVLELLNQGRPNANNSAKPILGPAREVISDLFLVDPRRF